VNIRFGLDLASVASIEANLASHGDRYLARIYTTSEIEASRRAGAIEPRRLAERFAAKEATLKVLPAADEGLDFRSIELLVDPVTGRLDLVVHGRAAELATVAGITGLSISVTSDDRLAAAVVAAEIAGPEPDVEFSPRTSS
jgi:holo-[acyl-carrier protein] synthase